MNLRGYLEKKMREAFQDEWDPKRPTSFEFIGDGNVVGLRFYKRRQDGSLQLVYEEPPTSLTSKKCVDDLIARGLSIFLMKHPSWPR